MRPWSWWVGEGGWGGGITIRLAWCREGEPPGNAGAEKEEGVGVVWERGGGREVRGGYHLHGEARGDVERHGVGHRDELAHRHRRVLAVGACVALRCVGSDGQRVNR